MASIPITTSSLSNINKWSENNKSKRRESSQKSREAGRISLQTKGMTTAETRKSKSRKMIAIRKKIVKALLLIMLKDSPRMISINDFKLTYLE